MAAELWDILDFLDTLPDFAELDEATRNDLPRRMQVRYLRHDSPLDESHEGGAWLLRVGAIEVRDNLDGHLIDRVAEGGLILSERLEERHQGAVLIEDSLLYHLPRSTLAWLRSRQPDWPGPSEQDGAIHHAEPASKDAAEPLETRLSELPLPTVPICLGKLSIRAAARLMRDSHSDTLLVEDEEGTLCGILTDRDLRNRVLAEDTDPSQPVHTISSSPVRCIEHTRPVIEALNLLHREGIHHLPVLDEQGKPCWLFSDDSLGALLGDPGIHAGKRLERAHDLDELEQAWRLTPEPLNQPATIPVHVRLAQYNQQLLRLLNRATRLLDLQSPPTPAGALADHELLPRMSLPLNHVSPPLADWLIRIGLPHREPNSKIQAATTEAPIGFFRDQIIDRAGETHDTLNLMTQIVAPIRAIAASLLPESRLSEDEPAIKDEGSRTIALLRLAAQRHPDQPQFAALIRACDHAWLLAMRANQALPAGQYHQEPVIAVADLSPADRHILRQGLHALTDLNGSTPT